MIILPRKMIGWNIIRRTFVKNLLCWLFTLVIVLGISKQKIKNYITLMVHIVSGSIVYMFILLAIMDHLVIMKIWHCL